MMATESRQVIGGAAVTAAAASKSNSPRTANTMDRKSNGTMRKQYDFTHLQLSYALYIVHKLKCFYLLDFTYIYYFIVGVKIYLCFVRFSSFSWALPVHSCDRCLSSCGLRWRMHGMQPVHRSLVKLKNLNEMPPFQLVHHLLWTACNSLLSHMHTNKYIHHTKIYSAQQIFFPPSFVVFILAVFAFDTNTIKKN